jgi:hypothetical protein
VDSFDIREIMTLLGEKDLIIYQQNKMIQALQTQLAALQEKPTGPEPSDAPPVKAALAEFKKAN